MSIRKFATLLYIFSFFLDFVLINAVDKLFFIYRGLDLAEIAVMLTIMSVLTIIFEIPSGAIADRWDRKTILMISGFSRAACMVVWIFSMNLPMFILGFTLLVAGYSFESGTMQAYVYDYLKLQGKEDDFEKVWGRGGAARLIGIAVALALGGFVSDYSYEVTVGLSAAGPVIGIIIVALWPRSPEKLTSESRHYLRILTGGIRKAVGTPVFVRIFLFTGIVLAGHNILDQYIPVLLQDRLNLSNTLIGFWLAIGVGLGRAGSLTAHRLKGGNWKILAGITVLTGALLSIVVFTHSPAILGVLIVFYIGGSVCWILVEGIIQRNIDSAERATITSVNSFFQQAGAAIGGLIFGFLGNRYGIHVGYGLYGAVFLVYSLVSVFTMKRKRRRIR